MVDSFLNSMDIFPSFQNFQESKDDQGAFTIDQKDREELNKISSINQSKQNNNNNTEITKQSNTNSLAQCDICLVPISSQIVYDTHIKGRKHQIQLKSLLSKNPEYKPLTYEELCSKKQESIIQNNENNNSLPLIATKKLNCNICNVSCNSQQMFDNHVTGKKHQTKLKLASFTNPAPVRNVPDNNPSSSNFCDICSLKLNSEEELTEHLAQKKHQTRVKETETCAKEANDMNINLDDYKISTTDVEKDSFNFQCTICNKKFHSKIQVIDHLKSALHIRLSNQSNDQNLSNKSNQNNYQTTRGNVIRGSNRSRNQNFSTYRGSNTSGGRFRPYGSQRSSRNPSLDPQISQNISGTFNQDNQSRFTSNNNNNNYSSTKRSIQYEENLHEYDGFYPKRHRTYNDHNDNLQNFYTEDGNYYSSNSDPSSVQNTNYHNQSSVSQPHWQYQTDSYYNQQQYSNPESNYMNPMYYSLNQPPLPDYEPPPPPLPTYPPPPSSNPSYSQHSSYYSGTENSGNNHFYPNSSHH